MTLDQKNYLQRYYEVHRDHIINHQLTYYREHREKYMAYMKEYNRNYYLTRKAKQIVKMQPVAPEEPKEPQKPPKEPKAPKPPREPKEPKAPKPTLKRKEPPRYRYETGVFEMSFD